MNNIECIQSGPQPDCIDPAAWASLSHASGNGGKIFSHKNRNSRTLLFRIDSQLTQINFY